MCRVVDTVLIDQERIYLRRHGDDRLLLGLKGSLNEYELDLLRQRSLSARDEKPAEASWSSPRRSASSKLATGLSGPASPSGRCIYDPRRAPGCAPLPMRLRRPKPVI
jgi:hypothetical protein